MSVIETQKIVDELCQTINTMLDKADEIANLRETLVDLQIKLDKSLCPWSIAPLGYEACFGSGDDPDNYRGTISPEGYSHILYKGKPVFMKRINGKEVEKRNFPKANAEKGIIQKSDGYYYKGTTGKLYKLDEKYTEFVGIGRNPRQQ